VILGGKKCFKRNNRFVTSTLFPVIPRAVARLQHATHTHTLEFFKKNQKMLSSAGNGCPSKAHTTNEQEDKKSSEIARYLEGDDFNFNAIIWYNEQIITEN
jgi:hypothetical protein